MWAVLQGDDKTYHQATERVIEIMSGDFEGVVGSGEDSDTLLQPLRTASQGFHPDTIKQIRKTT